MRRYFELHGIFLIGILWLFCDHNTIKDNTLSRSSNTHFIHYTTLRQICAITFVNPVHTVSWIPIRPR